MSSTRRGPRLAPLPLALCPCLAWPESPLLRCATTGTPAGRPLEQAEQPDTNTQFAQLTVRAGCGLVRYEAALPANCQHPLAPLNIPTGWSVVVCLMAPSFFSSLLCLCQACSSSPPELEHLQRASSLPESARESQAQAMCSATAKNRACIPVSPGAMPAG
jgi:hypothetical protein